MSTILDVLPGFLSLKEGDRALEICREGAYHS